MKANEIERRFDDGEEVLAHFDLTKARRPNRTAQRVNVDFPSWIIGELDREAHRIGVTRQSLIKLWIAERLERTVKG